MLPAELLGDDPVAAGGADVVEIGLHEQFARQALRRAGQRQTHVLDVEPGAQPERTHEHRLAHAMDLAQSGPVGVSRHNLLPVNLRIQDFVDHPEDAAEAQSDGTVRWRAA